MEAKYINPFINAVVTTMETMMDVSPVRGTPYLKGEHTTQGDISSIIGFGGPNISGSVALSFPLPVALKIYSLMMGETVYRITSDVQDVVGEIANIVAGAAKAEMSEQELSFELSIPTVVIGKGHVLGSKGDIPVMVIPMEIGKHRFIMEITMKFKK
jgi:chemotaxis protein CheX